MWLVINILPRPPVAELSSSSCPNWTRKEAIFSEEEGRRQNGVSVQEKDEGNEVWHTHACHFFFNSRLSYLVMASCKAENQGEKEKEKGGKEQGGDGGDHVKD